MKSFESWETEDLKLTFGLRQLDKHPVLTDWLAADEPISGSELQDLEKWRTRLGKRVNYWNEEEVKIFFILKVIELVDFNNEGHYTTFSERTLASKLRNIRNEEVTMRGRIEFLVATGEQKPRQPFFFIHEYKPLLKATSNDPLGQLLSAMFTVQDINQNQKVLYGLYVLGQYWYFVILDGKDFSVSLSLDAAKPNDLLQIVRILKRCKGYIEKDLGLI